MSPRPLVLVTGVTGFLGSHVVSQLLEAGYRVRGTARSAKVAQAQEGYSTYGEQYEVVAIDDLVSGDFTEALKGVSAVIHTAAPLPGRASPSEALDAAVEGSLNVIRQAERAGIKNFSYTSSIVTVASWEELTKPTSVFSDKYFVPVSKEDALEGPGSKNPFLVYVVEKTLAERAIWDFVDKHPHIEMTTVNPPFFYGPFAPGFRNPDAKIAALSTNFQIYDLIRSDGPAPGPSYIDVRDVARGLVNALVAPPTSQVGRKRIIMSGEWFSAKDAVEYLEEVRPELKGRLSENARRAPPAPKTPVDNTRAAQVLKLKFTGWKQTILETVDDLLRFEKEWKAKGLTPH